MKILGGLPQEIARTVVIKQQGLSGISPKDLDDFKVKDLIQARLMDYQPEMTRYPAVTIGVGMGGASAHLALAMGGPYLPEAFVLSLKGGSIDGNVQIYLMRSLELARRITLENPEIVSIQHYDPVHDGWLTRRLNHLRLKLTDLPLEYEEFIRERLTPGGEVCYLEGGARWLRYRVGPRNVFQVGGWGSISPEEFLEGSERIHRMARHEGMKHLDWRLDDYPLERGPESEWGSEQGLGHALEAFCQKEGFQFTRIHFGNPHHFSKLAFMATQRQLEKQGCPAGGILIETFTQFDATAVLKAGLLPVWLVFNTKDSLEYLKQMEPHFPKNSPVFFSPLSTFSITPDLVSFDDWAQVMGEHEWINIGARKSHYPADTRALVEWNLPLRKWCECHPNPIEGRLSAVELAELADVIRAES